MAQLFSEDFTAVVGSSSMNGHTDPPVVWSNLQQSSAFYTTPMVVNGQGVVDPGDDSTNSAYVFAYRTDVPGEPYGGSLLLSPADFESSGTVIVDFDIAQPTGVFNSHVLVRTQSVNTADGSNDLINYGIQFEVTPAGAKAIYVGSDVSGRPGGTAPATDLVIGFNQLTMAWTPDSLEFRLNSVSLVTYDVGMASHLALRVRLGGRILAIDGASDEPTPVVGEFWSNIVKAVEAP